MDTGSRSLGGLLAEPITRHAYPQNVSDAAFAQLVDGDPKDKDPDAQAQGRRLHRPDPGGRGDLGHPPPRGRHPRPERSTPTNEQVQQGRSTR